MGSANSNSAHIAFVTSLLSLRKTLTMAHRSSNTIIAATAIQKYVTGSVMITSPPVVPAQREARATTLLPRGSQQAEQSSGSFPRH
ncbi:hypothetical protein D3C72_2167740 [compost metagenome]